MSMTLAISYQVLSKFKLYFMCLIIKLTPHRTTVLKNMLILKAKYS